MIDVTKDESAHKFDAVEKLRVKNRPTFFLRDNDTLLNLPPTILQDFTPLCFQTIVNKLRPLLIKSEAELCKHLSKGGLEHVTIVYYTSAEDDQSKTVDQE